jgi:uncharacterized membrane protein YfcA
MGLFAGGALGGLLAKHLGAQAVFVACAALMLVWLLVVAWMRVPPPVRTRVVAVSAGLDPEELRRRLVEVPGVRAAVVVPGEGVARLEVVPGWDEPRVMNLVNGRA